MPYIALCTFMAKSQQKEARNLDYGLLSSNDFKPSRILYNNMDITAHSSPLNSREHCIRTTSMTNIQPGWDSNPVPSHFTL